MIDIEKEREAFESWATDKFPIAGLGQFEKHNNGTYIQRSIRNMYEAWQAAKAQAVPEWISTEDKEPVENGNYLVCIDGGVFYLTAKWVKNHFKFLARGYGLTEDFTDWRYCEGVKVTHWMLLPDSPKAQEPAND